MQATNELYNQYAGLINSATRNICIAYPKLDRNDVLSEANLIFINAAETYDESRGTTFGTHLKNKLKALTHLTFGCDYKRTFCFSQLAVSSDDDTSSTDLIDLISEANTAYNPFKDGDPDVHAEGFDEYYRVLSSDAKFLYKEILCGRFNRIHSYTTRKGTRSTVYNACISIQPHYIVARLAEAVTCAVKADGMATAVVSTGAVNWDKKRAKAALEELKSVVSQYITGKVPHAVPKFGLFVGA